MSGNWLGWRLKAYAVACYVTKLPKFVVRPRVCYAGILFLADDDIKVIWNRHHVTKSDARRSREWWRWWRIDWKASVNEHTPLEKRTMFLALAVDTRARDVHFARLLDGDLDKCGWVDQWLLTNEFNKRRVCCLGRAARRWEGGEDIGVDGGGIAEAV